MVAANQPTCGSSTSNEMASEGQQFVIATSGTLNNAQVQFVTLPDADANTDTKSFILLPGAQQTIQLNGTALQVLQSGPSVPLLNVNGSYVIPVGTSVETTQPSTSSSSATQYVYTADTKDLDLSTVLQAFTQPSQFSPQQCVLQVAQSSSAVATAAPHSEEPLYVNAKQYKRIMRRREIRAKLEQEGKISKVRKKYLHESRHRHALTRIRGEGGKFDKGAGKDDSKKPMDLVDQIRTIFRPAWMDRTLAPAVAAPSVPPVDRTVPSLVEPKAEFSQSQE